MVINKKFLKNKDDEKFINKINLFKKNSVRTFDISKCKCEKKCNCHTLKGKESEPTVKLRSQNVKNQINKSVDNTKYTSNIINGDESKTVLNTKIDIDTDDNDCDYVLVEKKSKIDSMELKNICSIADRYGVSNTVAAALVNATLQDFGVFKENPEMIVDRHKIRRHRSKYREECNTYPENIIGLYFDGRKDQTNTYEIRNNLRKR